LNTLYYVRGKYSLRVSPVPLVYIRTRIKNRGNTAADRLRYKRKTGVFRHIFGEDLLR